MKDDHHHSLFRIFSEASYVRNLYKSAVHPAVSNLYFVAFARPGFAYIPAIVETQARWVVSLAAGRCQALPSERELISTIAADQTIE
jgi:hypothetical protein